MQNTTISTEDEQRHRAAKRRERPENPVHLSREIRRPGVGEK